MADNKLRRREWAIALLIVGWLAWCVYYYDAGKFRSMYDEIQRLKLNVATIAPIHGRGAVPIAELRKFIGKKG